MKAISVLGTSSNAGKSWVATALCAWLRKEGVSVAPFKAQNMANNAFATLEGGEIGVAQAVQAEACGRRPIAEMNPILLKPNGEDGSQVVLRGEAGQTLRAREYYERSPQMWDCVTDCLEYWKTRCDVLVLEGAGSPVELNLMHKDLVNLRPIRHLNGRWLLVSNIEYGGVFAQTLGTWDLMPNDLKPKGLGAIVNRFRGDLSLFDDAARIFRQQMKLPYLGTIPLRPDLRIEDEDSISSGFDQPAQDPQQPYIAWIRYPRVSNSQDMAPWQCDEGVTSVWTDEPEVVRKACSIILPGSKNTFADLAWLRRAGLDAAILSQSAKGVPVVGICGGLQMLGERLEDLQSGDTARGLGLLPQYTQFENRKQVFRNRARWEGDEWETFEIHQGKTESVGEGELDFLCKVCGYGNVNFKNDGYVKGRIWGSYQHGLFESPAMRQRLLIAAGLPQARVSTQSWRDRKSVTYRAMAECLERSVDLTTVRSYLGL